MGEILDAALKYQEQGFSIIPVQKNKKPYIAWEKYQKEKADVELIKQWWQKYPNANLAIVTGKISNLDVIDLDSQEAMNAIDEMLPDSLITPVAKTPRGGRHYYHQSVNGLGNSTGFMKDCDFRGNGGYIIAPPSTGYSWLPNLSISDVEPAPLPDTILKAIKASSQGAEGNNVRQVDFSRGTRDDSLFHTALNLLKGGTPVEEVKKVIVALGTTCKPPFPAKEALLKVESAIKRLQTGERNLTEDLRQWIEGTEGEFYTRDVFEELNIAPDKKGTVSKILTRLIEERLIERAGKRTGCFRRIEKELIRMDLLSSETKTVNINLPLKLNDLVEIMPGNIIIVGGAKDAGKTTFLLNVVKDNFDQFKIHYFNSEMGESEFRKRLKLFNDIPFREWQKANFYERNENFQDVIVPTEGNINIIDYLEVYEDFWLVKKRVAEIWRKLDGAIGIIGLQKPQGRDIAFGGEGSIEKARLAVALDNGMMKILTAKNWKTTENPKGKEIKFKIVGGSKIIEADNWNME